MEAVAAQTTVRTAVAVSTVAAVAAPTATALDERTEEAAVAKQTARKKLQKFSKEEDRRVLTPSRFQDFKISRFDLLREDLCGR